MGRYCTQCGTQLEEGWRVCPSCGTPIVQLPAGVEDPGAVGVGPPEPVERPAPGPDASLGERLGYVWGEASGPAECPGCHRAVGSPGTLCPYCGSRFPSPRATLVGLAIGAVGVVLLVGSLLVTGGLLETGPGEDTPLVEGLGWLALIVGIGTVVYSAGRAGPQRQTSCCGCSCVVALVAVPTIALALWSWGGPVTLALAIPAWLVLTRTMDGALAIGRLLVGAIRAAREGSRSRRVFPGRRWLSVIRAAASPCPRGRPGDRRRLRRAGGWVPRTGQLRAGRAAR